MDSIGNDMREEEVILLYIELLAEYSYYRSISGEVDTSVTYNRILDEYGIYDDLKRSSMYNKRFNMSKDTLFYTGTPLTVIHNNLMKFIEYYFDIGEDHRDTGYDSHDTDRFIHSTYNNRFKKHVRVTREFVKNMYSLDKDQMSEVIREYFIPIARGHIKEKCN